MITKHTILELIKYKDTFWQSFRNDGQLEIIRSLYFQGWAVWIGFLGKDLPEAEIIYLLSLDSLIDHNLNKTKHYGFSVF